MKTFIAEGKKRSRNLSARSWKSAEDKAKKLGLKIVGELQYSTDINGVVLEIGLGCKLPLMLGQPVQLPV